MLHYAVLCFGVSPGLCSFAGAGDRVKGSFAWAVKSRFAWVVKSRCLVMQIIDRLCASVHYRQAVSCEDSGTNMASSPSSDCLLRIAMTHKKVVHLPLSMQQAASTAAGNRAAALLLLLCHQVTL